MKAGQATACESINISEDLFTVLSKMNKFYPDISLRSSDDIELYYGSEASKGSDVGAGVEFLFNKDYKLTYKTCDGKWEPAVPGLG